MNGLHDTTRRVKFFTSKLLTNLRQIATAFQTSPGMLHRHRYFQLRHTPPSPTVGCCYHRADPKQEHKPRYQSRITDRRPCARVRQKYIILLTSSRSGNLSEDGGAGPPHARLSSLLPSPDGDYFSCLRPTPQARHLPPRSGPDRPENEEGGGRWGAQRQEIVDTKHRHHEKTAMRNVEKFPKRQERGTRSPLSQASSVLKRPQTVYAVSCLAPSGPPCRLWPSRTENSKTEPDDRRRQVGNVVVEEPWLSSM